MLGVVARVVMWLSNWSAQENQEAVEDPEEVNSSLKLSSIVQVPENLLQHWKIVGMITSEMSFRENASISREDLKQFLLDLIPNIAITMPVFGDLALWQDLKNFFELACLCLQLQEQRTQASQDLKAAESIAREDARRSREELSKEKEAFTVLLAQAIGEENKQQERPRQQQRTQQLQ
uniref:Uncharacterized protein n=1 Tax=Anopheles culicifacies TaxID=139723 RepID=A0A182MPX7_9DIPT